MLDCLNNPAGVVLPGPGEKKPSSSPAVKPSVGGILKGGGGSLESLVDVGGVLGAGKGGEVVVLHYYHQEHERLLKEAVLETMNRWGEQKGRFRLFWAFLLLLV